MQRSHAQIQALSPSPDVPPFRRKKGFFLTLLLDVGDVCAFVGSLPTGAGICVPGFLRTEEKHADSVSSCKAQPRDHHSTNSLNVFCSFFFFFIKSSVCKFRSKIKELLVKNNTFHAAELCAMNILKRRYSAGLKTKRVSPS